MELVIKDNQDSGLVVFITAVARYDTISKKAQKDVCFICFFHEKNCLWY